MKILSKEVIDATIALVKKYETVRVDEVDAWLNNHRHRQVVEFESEHVIIGCIRNFTYENGMCTLCTACSCMQ